MMTLKEYALDVNKSIQEIIEMCKKLGIKASKEDDMLLDDDIILLDNEIGALSSEESDDVSSDSKYEEEVDDDELEKDLRIDMEQDTSVVKMKRKPVSKKTDNKEYLKAKKDLYKHKEKLQANDATNDKIILYKEGMTVKDVADALGENPANLIKNYLI